MTVNEELLVQLCASLKDALEQLNQLHASSQNQQKPLQLPDAETTAAAALASNSDDKNSTSAVGIHSHMIDLSKVISHHAAVLALSYTTAGPNSSASKTRKASCERLGDCARRLVRDVSDMLGLVGEKGHGRTVADYMLLRVYDILDSMHRLVSSLQSNSCSAHATTVAGSVLAACQALEAAPATNNVAVSYRLTEYAEQLDDVLAELQELLDPSGGDDGGWDDLLDDSDDDGSQPSPAHTWIESDKEWIQTATKMVKTVQLTVKKLSVLLADTNAFKSMQTDNETAVNGMMSAMDDLVAHANSCVVAADNLVGEITPPSKPSPFKLHDVRDRLDAHVQALAASEQRILDTAKHILAATNQRNSPAKPDSNKNNTNASTAWTEMCIKQITTLAEKLAIE